MSIEAVDYIFSRLAAEYGAEWDRAIGQAPLSDVKTVWLERIGDFTRTDAAKKAILWALKNLPERAPNAIQFRNLCRQAPAVEVPRLPEPKPDPERLAAELAKLGPLRQSIMASASAKDCKEWARRLIANPESTTQASLQMAKNALGVA